MSYLKYKKYSPLQLVSMPHDELQAHCHHLIGRTKNNNVRIKLAGMAHGDVVDIDLILEVQGGVK